MSPIKETNFFALKGQKPDFAGPDRFFFNQESIYRLEDYKRLFAGKADEIAVGEASPRYLFTSGTAERIHALIPETKLIAILRNPADRAFSAFSMRKRDGWETCGTFEDAILQEEKRLKRGWASGIYLQRGYYGSQLSEYYHIFPREQICVFLYDKLRDDLEGLLACLYRFIGVDEDFHPDTRRHYNESGVIKNPILRLLWTRTHSVQNVLRPMFPKSLRKLISRYFIGSDKERLSLSVETRKMLIDLYRDDILQLEDLIEEDLSTWYRV